MNVRVMCACLGGTLAAITFLAAGCGDTSSPSLVSGSDSGAGVGDGSTSGDGSSTNDGSTTSGDSGAIALGGDGGSPDDAGPGGTTSIITCGGTTCSIPAEQCCVYANQNPPPDFSYECSSAGVCPAAGGGGDPPSELKCSSAANCPSGTVCCVHQGGGNTVSSACQTSCTGGQAQLCDPASSPAASGCGDAGACSNANIGDWGLPASFGTCGGKGN